MGLYLLMYSRVPLSQAASRSSSIQTGALTHESLLAHGSCYGNRFRNFPYKWEAVPEEGLS